MVDFEFIIFYLNWLLKEDIPPYMLPAPEFDFEKSIRFGLSKKLIKLFPSSIISLSSIKLALLVRLMIRFLLDLFTSTNKLNTFKISLIAKYTFLES